MKFYKKIIVSALSASLLFSSANFSFADVFTIHKEVETNKLSGGIVHENIKQFTSDGWYNINVIKVDLSDEYTNIKPIFSSSGVSKRDKVSNMVKDSKAIAGINADFFSNVHFSSPLGVMVSEGKLITSPTSMQKQLPIFNITADKKPNMFYLNFIAHAIAENGTEHRIWFVNRDSQNFDGLVMLDSSFGEYSVGNKYFQDMVEVVIVEDVVTEVRVGMDPVKIPQNGYILVGRGPVSVPLQQNFPVGSKPNLKIITAPDHEELQAAIGGGATLIKEGKIHDFEMNIRGNHPRTALGITEDRNTILLVTVDGRHSSFKGVSQTRLAQIMLDLGSYEAINFDGGGSTTMAVSPKYSDQVSLLNHPSDGAERRVANGLGVFNTAPISDLEYIEVDVEDFNVFMNTSRKINVKAFDKYRNPLEVYEDKVSISVSSGEAEISDLSVIPKLTGKLTVNIDYLGKTKAIDLNVLSVPKILRFDVDKFSVDTGQEVNLNNLLGNVHAEDENGFSAKLSVNDIKFEAVKNVGEIKDGIFTSSVIPKYGALVATAGDATRSIPCSIGYTAYDLDKFEEIGEKKFLSYPNSVTGGVSLDERDVEGSYSLKLSYDFSKTDETRAAYVSLKDEGHLISTPPEKIGMWVYGNKSGHWLRGKVVDASGETFNIDFAQNIDFEDWKWVTAKIPNSAQYPIKLHRIYLVETNPMNKSTGEILIDGLKTLYSVPKSVLILPEDTLIEDSSYGIQDSTSSDFTVSSIPIESETLMDIQVKNAISKHFTSSYKNFVFKSPNGNLNENINFIKEKKGYFSFADENALFIQLDVSKNGIRATDANQWLYIQNEISSSNKDNVVLLLSKPVFGNNGFSDKLESELFRKKLNEYAKTGKNVFVVYQGNEYEYSLENGVRYIEFKAHKNSSEFEQMKVLKFKFVEGKLKYEFENLF